MGPSGKGTGIHIIGGWAILGARRAGNIVPFHFERPLNNESHTPSSLLASSIDPSTRDHHLHRWGEWGGFSELGTPPPAYPAFEEAETHDPSARDPTFSMHIESWRGEAQYRGSALSSLLHLCSRISPGFTPLRGDQGTSVAGGLLNLKRGGEPLLLELPLIAGTSSTLGGER